MYGFKSKAQREREQALSPGLIEGPGTGTSDSIKAKIPRGSYIMPADSTEKIGAEALAQMGARGFKPGVFDPAAVAPTAPGQGFGFKPRSERVNARVSDGEFQLPPEQVHAIGAQALDQVKDATHTPTGPRGFKPKGAELFFADGGAVRAPDLGFKPGSRPAPTQDAPRLGFGPTSVGAKIMAGGQAFADGGVVESTDDLIARISGKYGTGAASAEKPQSAAPVQRPAQRPAPAPTIGSAADAIRTRRQQIDAAAGYADGGLVDEEPRRAVAGAPGVQRVGNSYSDAPTSTGTAAAGQPQGFGFKPQSEPVAEAAPASQPGLGFRPQGAAAQTRTPTFGETQNRINDQRAERTGTGLYGTPRTEAQKTADTGLPGYQDRVNAIPGPSNDARIGMQRLAAQQQPSPAAPAPKAKQPPAARPAEPGLGFSAWQGQASQQERDTAADVYRTGWQQQAPGGMRNAGADATTLYNAEQQVRGTGITAQRGANGQMSFSGNGADALPQSYTQGVDLNAANASMARANAVRDSMLQGSGSGTPGGGAIADTSAADTNATLGRWGQERAIQRAIDSGNPKVMEGVSRLVGNTGERYATDAQIASRDRNAAADRTQRGEIAAAGFDAERGRAYLEQQRLGLDERRANGELRAMGFQARGLERLENLQTQYEQAKTPEQRAQLAEQIRVMTGREAPNRYTVVPGGQELTEQGMRTVPSRVLNNQTGQFVEQPAAASQPAVPRVGEVRSGYRFTGGDPAQQSSWQKV